MELRKNRPRRETEQDQADILLLKEKQELLNIKKIHESQFAKIKVDFFEILRIDLIENWVHCLTIQLNAFFSWPFNR